MFFYQFLFTYCWFFIFVIFNGYFECKWLKKCLLPSLRSRRLEVAGEGENGAREGDTQGVRERLHGRPPKIVSTRTL